MRKLPTSSLLDVDTTVYTDKENDAYVNEVFKRFPFDWMSDRVEEQDKVINKAVDKLTRYGDVVELIDRLDKIIRLMQNNEERVRRDAYQKGYNTAKKKYKIREQ